MLAGMGVSLPNVIMGSGNVAVDPDPPFAKDAKVDGAPKRTIRIKI